MCALMVIAVGCGSGSPSHGDASPTTATGGSAGHSAAGAKGTGGLTGTGGVVRLGTGGAGGGAGVASIAVQPLIGATAITAGAGFACALLSDSTVDCWGNNGNGQLGNGTTVGYPSAVKVANLNHVVSIASNSMNNFVCAVVSESSDGGVIDAGADGGASEAGVWCWGQNNYGQLGNGTTTDSSVPVRVGLTGVQSLMVGELQTYANTSNGLFRWGADTTTTSLGLEANSPTPISASIPGVTAVLGTVNLVDGSGFTPCVLLGTGAVDCPTHSNSGVTTPNPITNATALVGGNGYACALTGGVVDCWGSEAVNLIPNDVNTDGSMIMQVAGFTGLTALSADGGGLFLCGLLANGSIQCQFAAGVATGPGDAVPTATTQATGGTFSALAAGNGFVCGLVTNGTVECWGATILNPADDNIFPPTAVPAPGAYCTWLLAYCNSASTTPSLGSTTSPQATCLGYYSSLGTTESGCQAFP